MDEQKSINSEILKNLEFLNKQVSELVNSQRKVVSGYNYINAHELAEMLGESIKTIYGRVYNRQIPYYKPGGKVLLFKIDEIQRWIESGRYSSLDELRQKL
jgi:excisionase family DNA binding protein